MHSPPLPSSPLGAGPAPRRQDVLAAAVLGSLGLGTLLAAALELRPLLTLDARIAVDLHTYTRARPAFAEVQRVFTDWVWDPWTMRLLLAALVAWLWRRRQWACAAGVVATAGLWTGVQQGLKALVDRERPHWSAPLDSAHYAAMPSGHTLTLAVTAVLLVWALRSLGCGPRARRTAAVLGGISTLGVAFTRLALGVHWFSDTLAGALLGAGLALGGSTAAARLVRRRGGLTPAPNAARGTRG